jgi:hypothetical protein
MAWQQIEVTARKPITKKAHEQKKAKRIYKATKTKKPY